MLKPCLGIGLPDEQCFFGGFGFAEAQAERWASRWLRGTFAPQELLRWEEQPHLEVHCSELAVMEYHGFFCITSWYTSWYHCCIHPFPSFSHHFPMIFPWFSYLFGISRPTSCSEQPGTTGSSPPWRLPRAALFALASWCNKRQELYIIIP